MMYFDRRKKLNSHLIIVFYYLEMILFKMFTNLLL